ncbi:MAG: hypothetical protein Q9169_006109, partial [Polycauliona sp. 2 TL-2023]
MADKDRGASEPFRYKSLSTARNIRVMQLLPADSETHDLRCSLEQICLDDPPQYEALSYTWGDPANPSLLYCDGATLSITSNLDTALRHLRLKAGSRTLWVDAICINQADVNERNQQVALMRDVYTKASQVVAWLGEERPSDSGAMYFGDPKPLPEQSSERRRMLKIICLQTKFASSILSATILIQRPWFSRAWIIQEAALAKRLQVQCGKKVIDWETLYANSRLMDGMVDGSGDQITFNNEFFQRIEFVNFTRREIEVARKGNPLTQIAEQRSTGSLTWRQFHSAVVSGRMYGASDKRDHIYALLALIDEPGGEPISVDYSLPHATVFRNFVRRIIQETGNLSALGQIDSLSSTSLESWVPDYSRPSSVESLSSDEQPTFTASGDSEVRSIEPDNISVLSLSGILFDMVDEVAMGPNTEKEKIFTRSERLIFDNADKLDPLEVVPKVAIKTIRHIFPRSIDVFDQISQVMGLPEDTKTQESNGPTLSARDARYKSIFDIFSDPDSDSIELKQKISDVVTSTFKDLRAARKASIFGPTHASNKVYMKPALEGQWQRLALKCHPYPTEDHTEDVYWRTLISNKRTLLAGNFDEPPEVWRYAYNVWHAMLGEREGMIPRYLHLRGLRHEILPIFKGRTITKEKEDTSLPEECRLYLRDLKADQQKIDLDKQLGASGMRAIVSEGLKVSQDAHTTPDSVVHSLTPRPQRSSASTAAKITHSSVTEMSFREAFEASLVITNHKKPDGFEPLSAETINQVADWVKRYPDIEPEEKDRLRELLSPMADNNALKQESIDTSRARINQAFRYDFLRVARNRKFCITQKRYMGWCPFNTEPGDRICILFGGQTPYVVRKEGAGYRLLGEAYIHGVMHGEVLNMPNIKIEMIRLHALQIGKDDVIKNICSANPILIADTRMPLTVLSDSETKAILYSLTREDVLNLQNNLTEALHEYSTGTQETTGCCQSNQPQRIAIPASNNQTTLFMPASTSTSRGIKIATLARTPEPPRNDSLPSIKSTTSHASSTSSSTAQSTPSTPTTLASQLSNTSISPSPHPPSLPSSSQSTTTSPIGSLTLLTASGTPYAFLSASTLTAFRTALAATLLFTRRTTVHTLVVFGAGLQALWHIRLALLLRGAEIHHVHIINRSFDRARTLMQEIYTSPTWTELRNSNEKLDFSILSGEYGEYNRLLKERVRKADVVFCCTPSMSPLFPAEFLTSVEGRKKGRLVAAIGSFRGNMI